MEATVGALLPGTAKLSLLVRFLEISFCRGWQPKLPNDMKNYNPGREPSATERIDSMQPLKTSKIVALATVSAVVALAGTPGLSQAQCTQGNPRVAPPQSRP